MKTINLEDWPRRDHYLFFKEFEYPYFSLCADMDITRFLASIKGKGISFTGSIMYLIARVANSIPEFRQRVRERDPIEHEVVHPSATILSKENYFTFCTVEYHLDFERFISDAEKAITGAKNQLSLEEKYPDDRVLFMSPMPWVSFTSFMHPLKLCPGDSVPRFAWGKYREENQKTVMPLAVQGHHAVMDGLHLGLFYKEFQALLNGPELIDGL